VLDQARTVIAAIHSRQFLHLLPISNTYNISLGYEERRNTYSDATGTGKRHCLIVGNCVILMYWMAGISTDSRGSQTPRRSCRRASRGWTRSGAGACRPAPPRRGPPRPPEEVSRTYRDDSGSWRSSQVVMLRARVGIGSEPWSRTAAWKAGSENAGPRRRRASCRRRSISSLPVR
jgi:hypothetical protein